MQAALSVDSANPYGGMPNQLDFTPAAAAKVAELIIEEGNPELKLRVFVTGGGCSGFQYGFTFDESRNDDDTVMEKERILQEAKEKAEKETQLAIDSAMRQIEFEKNKAIRDVREEIATLSVAVAEKIIRGKIEKESGQKEVISRLIDEITLSKS